jgi:hypothetical protein
MATSSEEFDWDPFIGRALALIILEQPELKAKGVLERAEYLMNLGLPRKEAALLVGSSDHSLSELARRKAKKATGAK